MFTYTQIYIPTKRETVKETDRKTDRENEREHMQISSLSDLLLYFVMVSLVMEVF